MLALAALTAPSLCAVQAYGAHIETGRAGLHRRPAALRRQARAPWVRVRGGGEAGGAPPLSGLSHEEVDGEVDGDAADNLARDVSAEEDEALDILEVSELEISEDWGDDDDAAAPKVESKDEGEDAAFEEVETDDEGEELGDLEGTKASTESGTPKPTSRPPPDAASAGGSKGPAGSASAAAELPPAPPMIPILLQVAKQMAITAIGMAVVKKLNPTDPRCIRLARAIYTLYLVIFHGLCMFMRVIVWQERSSETIEIPPPKVVPQLLQKLSTPPPAAEEGSGAAGAEAAGQALPPGVNTAVERLLTRKVSQKKYDMDRIDAMRLSQSVGSIFMALLHFRFGMIRPMILQAALGLLGLFDEPLFHILVLRRKAVGNLARPFKPPGGMGELLAAQSARHEAAQAAAAAAAAAPPEAAEGEDEDDNGAEGDGDEGEVDDFDD